MVRRDHKQRIEINQSEIDNLKGMFPERSSEVAASVILFSDWFICVGRIMSSEENRLELSNKNSFNLGKHEDSNLTRGS